MDNFKRIMEIEERIEKLREERARLCNVVAHIFDEEREYLYEKDSKTYDQFINKRTGKLGKRVMSKQFRPFWNGIMNASMFKVFGYSKPLKYLSEEEIQILKPIIREQIDRLLEANRKGELGLW